MPVLDDRLVFLLTYPSSDVGLARKRLERLTEAGITEILDEGRVSLGRYRVLGKGHASVVLKAVWKGREVALKVLRTDSKRNTLKREAEMLRIANSVDVGPRLLFDLGFAVVMELVEGIRFGDWRPEDREEAKRVLRELLVQCRRLDRVGIDHGELSNPARHVIVGPKVVIIDFESASKERRPANVTSVVQYLFIGGKRSEFFRELLGVNGSELLPFLKKYKEELNDEAFQKLLFILNL